MARNKGQKAKPRLSKSKYLAGRQCLKRVWLTCHHRELATEPDQSLRAIFEMGHEIGSHARTLFPDGVLVSEKAWEHDEAMACTRELIANESVPAIFEAAFEHRGVRVRVDVLERLPGGQWGIREVKASTSLKDVHIDDLAVQAFVVLGSGLSVASVQLIHVDRNYVRGQQEIDWRAFFTSEEPSEPVEATLEVVASNVDEMHHVLSQPEPPAIEPSRHCSSPYQCEFWEHCTRNKPGDWVFHLPRLHADGFARMRSAGIDRISEIPFGFPLTPTQRLVSVVHRRGRPHVSSDLPDALDGAGPPAFYLDVETINPGVPLYAGTRPYQVIPFQWSLHHVGTDGKVSHQKFLADGSEDPRSDFVTSLLGAVGEAPDPILVYSPYEKRILGELSTLLPERAKELDALRQRLIDLLPIVRANVYHSAFLGSFSLKRVAPALVPGFGYEELEGVSDGGAASAAFLQIASARIDSAGAQRIREQLLAYCARDTQALVELHGALRTLSNSSLGADDTSERSPFE
jgi:predicted RecB family nuclease